MSERSDRVIILGGGVIGVSCADALARAGRPVTLVEADRVGWGCSHANCGYISPSHVLPLTEPGVVGKGLRGMLNPDAPLRIKPRWDPRLWGWLASFARRCNHRDMLAAASGIHALLQSSDQLYRELFANESLDCEWHQRGLLFVFQTEKGLDHYGETVKLVDDEFGVGATRYDGDAVTELEPALKPGLAGAWHYECDSHLRPDRLMDQWRKVIERLGVEIREGEKAQRLIVEGGQARGVVTSQGEVLGGEVVVALGALAPSWEKELGCRLPIQPGKGYSITMQRPKRCPTIPLMLSEHKVAVTPMDSAYRLGSTMEFAGYDATLNRRRLDSLRRGAAIYLHEPEAEPVEEEWFGWRPMTPDSQPIIDRSPRYENVWIAAGHNMLGLSMATGTGRLVRELVQGETPHIDPAAYSVKRFS